MLKKILLLSLLLPQVVCANINAGSPADTELERSVPGSARIEEWRQLLSSEKNLSLSENDKLKKVNDFFNQRINFASKDAIDDWAAPTEFLVKGTGNSKDYAMAKYLTLKSLGVAEDKMRITYVKAIDINKPHMVLTYYDTPRSIPVVLDSLDAQIKPANQRHDLQPVYSVTGSALLNSLSRYSRN